jgi:hypothetical protein
MLRALLPHPAPRAADYRASDGVNMAACWPERPPRCTASELASARGYLRRIFFHRLALGEFVDEFVEVADLAHHRLLNLLHADAAYGAAHSGDLDQPFRRIASSEARGA